MTGAASGAGGGAVKAKKTKATREPEAKAKAKAKAGGKEAGKAGGKKPTAANLGKLTSELKAVQVEWARAHATGDYDTADRLRATLRAANVPVMPAAAAKAKAKAKAKTKTIGKVKAAAAADSDESSSQDAELAKQKLAKLASAFEIGALTKQQYKEARGRLVPAESAAAAAGGGEGQTKAQKAERRAKKAAAAAGVAAAAAGEGAGLTELAGLVAEARAAAKPRKKLRLDEADGGEPVWLGSAGAKRPAGAKKAGQKKRKKRRVEAAVDTST